MPQIEIIKSDIVDKQGPKGPYKAVETVYKVDGKVKTINVFQFNKAVYPILSAAQAGDLFDVQFVQNDKGYWEINTIIKADKPTSDTSGSKVVSNSVSGGRSNWETSEERAARQVYIVRQSSVSSAIAYVEAMGNKKATMQDILNSAREIEAFVFENKVNNFVTEGNDVE